MIPPTFYANILCMEAPPYFSSEVKVDASLAYFHGACEKRQQLSNAAYHIAGKVAARASERVTRGYPTTTVEISFHANFHLTSPLFSLSLLSRAQTICCCGVRTLSSPFSLSWENISFFLASREQQSAAVLYSVLLLYKPGVGDERERKT